VPNSFLFLIETKTQSQLIGITYAIETQSQ